MGKKLKYDDFLKSKVKIEKAQGFVFDDSVISDRIKPHNRLMVKWLVEGGKRACFASFGLHKTVTQLEAIRCTLLHTGGRGLIVCPLNVKQEFVRDAVERLGWETPPKFIRRTEEAGATGIYITNYESVRDGRLDPRVFQAASLDEASALRGMGSSKTFREFMRLFTGDEGPNGNRRGQESVPYRYVATATPSPNDYIELLAYADFLGIMDISQAKTRFFKRDSTQSDNLTLHKHKEDEFWLWVASWALFVSKPSDLTGNENDDDGYILPEMEIHWHEVPSDHSKAGTRKDGQIRIINDSSLGLSDIAREKKNSLPARLAKVMELRELDPGAHRIIWHDLEHERLALENAIPAATSIFGKQDYEIRENAILDFSDGKFQELLAKPILAGSGCNFQRFCSWAIYMGFNDKFNDIIQSMYRLQRFLQENRVRFDFVYSEAERPVRKRFEKKFIQHNKQVEIMTKIIKKYGLSHQAMAKALTRNIGVERVEIVGDNYKIVNNDNVPETKSIAPNSVGLILTSIPFSMQYEYSPNYADFGHSESNQEFFEQMDYLTPNLYDALMPGRIAAIHVKDRIVPGGMTGLGFQTVYPFHKECIEHYTTCPDCKIRMAKDVIAGVKKSKPCTHRFQFLGMKTIVTDVVRENNQTYRLGWTEQCKDGSKMGVGMPEYLLLFRKPQSSSENAYADIPVVKDKTRYSRSRWQTDAHGFARSSGNRCLQPEELSKLKHDVIFKEFKDFSLSTVYDFEHHVKIGETLDAKGKLPSGFMLLQPQSWSEEVWSDVTRMLTLNGSQWSKGKEMHLCPFQFDIVDRAINQFSNEGEIVLDPFGGLMTVPYRAVLLKRFGYGIELNPSYFLDGAQYCKAAEEKISMPSLFDLIGTMENAECQ